MINDCGCAVVSDRLVSFGGADAGLARFWSDSRIEVVVPAAARTGTIKVQMESLISNAVAFFALPVAGYLKPTTGPSSGGNPAVIRLPYGGYGHTQVFFGTRLATEVVPVSFDAIAVTVPSGSGSVLVHVRANGLLHEAGTYTYTNP